MQRKNLIIVACAVMLAGCGGGSDTADQNDSVDWNKFSKDNASEYNMIAQKMADHYCDQKITYPDFTSSDWQYADYDDQDDGKVMVSAPVYINDQKYTMTSVISFDGTNMKGYYLAIGDQLYLDDGSCSDTMAKIGLPTATPAQ